MFIVPLPRSTALARAYFSTAPARRSPAVDVAETDTAYTLTLDLPGIPKEDVKVSIDGRRVDIEAQAAQSEERKESERIVYRERAESRYARSFTLPVELDEAQSTAKLENGVLTLTLTKRRPTVSRLQIN